MNASVIERKCPNCGATLKLPKTAFDNRLKCEYCNEEFALPRPQPRRDTPRVVRVVDPQAMAELKTSVENHTVAKVLGYAAVFFFIGLFLLIPMIQRASSSSTNEPKSQTSPPFLQTPPTPEAVPKPTPPAEPVVVFDRSGTSFVMDQMNRLDRLGCKKVLLPSSTVVGTQDVETKLIANKGCVHIVAATGDVGNPLDLYMQTPSRQEIATPKNSREINFVYCPKKTGKYPLKIVALESDLFTVAAVECPRDVDNISK